MSRTPRGVGRGKVGHDEIEAVGCFLEGFEGEVHDSGPYCAARAVSKTKVGHAEIASRHGAKRAETGRGHRVSPEAN